MAITGTLEVTPEQLISTSTSFQHQGSQVRGCTQEMLNLVNKFNGVWEGDAQRVYSSRLRMLNDDVQNITKKINEHVTDLQQMAAEYKRAESNNTSTATRLRTEYVN